MDLVEDLQEHSTTLEEINKEYLMEVTLSHPMERGDTRTETMREDLSIQTQRKKGSETQTMSMFILTNLSSSMCSL